MKNKWRILKILVTVILLGFLLSFSLKRFSNKMITENNVAVNLNSGNTPVYFVDEKVIKDIVAKQNPSHTVGNLDIPKLEKRLNAIPAVDSANVYLNLNGKLNLDITQRVPVFRLTKKGETFYVDERGIEFPVSKNYSHPCMLISGNVAKEEYPDVIQLVRTIEMDPFSKKYFIGVVKDGSNYNLLSTDGNYKVEIGDLDNIEFKLKGFKAFVEKFVQYQDPAKYSKISVKYDNQIVTTLNPRFQGNDSILAASSKELANAPSVKRQKAIAEATQRNNAENKKKENTQKKNN